MLRSSWLSTRGFMPDNAQDEELIDAMSVVGDNLPPEALDENADLRQQSRKTSVVRCLFITTLLTFGVIVANVALIMSLNEEEVRFRTEYRRLSSRLIDRFHEAFRERLMIADSIASQISWGHHTTTKEQPYLFSIPEFETQAEVFRELSSSMTISYAPFLRNQQEKEVFEDYASSMYDEQSRRSFKSKYLPHDAKYNFFEEPLMTYIDTKDWSVQEGIYHLVQGVPAEDNRSTVYAPVWQIAPFNDATKNMIMFNQMSEESRAEALGHLFQNHTFAISGIYLSNNTNSTQNEYMAPVVELHYPISRDITATKKNIVGVMTFTFGLEALLENTLHGFEDEPLTAVVQSSCGNEEEVSFMIQGETVQFLGPGNLKEKIPDVGAYQLVASTFEEFDDDLQSFSGIYPTSDHVFCSYRLLVFPTVDAHTLFLTNRPVLVQGVVALLFLFTVSIFLGYDCLVERRQRRVLADVTRTNSIVSSLFPRGVRDRLFFQNQTNPSRVSLEAAPFLRLKNFMANDNVAPQRSKSVKATTAEPIAELFPHCSVLFADVSGFSAWASERQPSEVFTLLETIFTSFDSIARKLNIFKVETVGDCYVAAAGVPQVKEDHALAMVRFANAIMIRADNVSRKLESRLGPGTGDLTLRVGIHSGQVTAGVLRGEKSRFQLFGDTMNLASRMQSTCLRGMIQVSTDTANILIEAGKAHWVEPRLDLVDVKGKGMMQTFWIRSNHKGGGLDGEGGEYAAGGDGSKQRLIDWNVTAMVPLIERIVASRSRFRFSGRSDRVDAALRPPVWNVKEEVQEVIELAAFDSQTVLRSEAGAAISPIVRAELRDYVSQISTLYLDNPFHNFSHASHVTMSCHKLFKRINRPDEVNYAHADKETVVKELHFATYGISSDPLTQLSIIIAALIHDTAHSGVPNAQLALERPIMVAKYGKYSVAEQHSLDVSLELLEAPCYANLRTCIFPTQDDQDRFRQLVINSVLATDIFDKDLGAMRKARWEKAFGNDSAGKGLDELSMDRKATIVLEHVIQASDVAHTMQHWKIYTKWNENLYREMYKAYEDGRSYKDPTEGWYEGELWFFDNYVIPLTKKLKECGVFGTSSDEYLHYALENRAEWKIRGQAIVEQMEKRVKEPRPGLVKGSMSRSSFDFSIRTTSSADDLL